MEEASLKSHAEEILHVFEGGRSTRDENVIASWNRCLTEHKLDPEIALDARIVTDRELRMHQQEVEEFLRMARYGLEDLYRRVDSMGYVLLLTDAKGVTVDFIGDDKVDRELRRAGLYLGSEWTEKEAGTCGVGACLITGEAIIVHQTDHFDITHIPLSCTSAPIYDSLGDLLGVLDVSLLTSPIEKYSQALTLEAVKSCVKRIERANLLAKHKSDIIVQLSPSLEFLEVDPSCAIAVAADGTLAGMTHGAQRVLANAVSVDWRNPQNLIGRPFEDFFDFDVNRLPSLARGARQCGNSLITKKGENAFAIAIIPPATSKRKKIPENSPKPLQALHGGDPKLQQLCEKAVKIVDKRISVVLHGETGVGKEFVAKAMHDSRSKKGPFIAINCASLPETLIESELFGYAPNSFTGASAKGKKGLIEQANGGTLFLDEIGDMPLALQTRLLRVLAEREVMAVGSGKAIPVDFQVISASHNSLYDLVEKGQFRQDLFYRINGIVLEIPPVRDRLDKAWLFERVLKIVRSNNQDARISPDALKLLMTYDWPGNVREIMNVFELCTALYGDSDLGVEHLPDIINSKACRTSEKPRAMANQTTSERDELIELLSKNTWNVSSTARGLGVDRTTLHRRMKRMDITSPNRQ